MSDHVKCISPQTPQQLVSLCVCEARISLKELACLLTYARRRLSATARSLPVIREDRLAMQRFEVPYDVPTEMWEVLTETSVALAWIIHEVQ